MAPPQTALFVIDIQHALAVDPEEKITHSERLVAAAQEVIDTARGVNTASVEDPALIVFVQHEEPPKSQGLVNGTEGWKLVFPPLDGAANEWLVAKTTQDTFESNLDLADKLRNAGITHIVTCGIQSECCVESSSKGALAAGFQVSLLQGAHSTYDTKEATALEIEKAVEERIAALGGKVVPYKSVLDSWKTAGALC